MFVSAERTRARPTTHTHMRGRARTHVEICMELVICVCDTCMCWMCCFPIPTDRVRHIACAWAEAAQTWSVVVTDAAFHAPMFALKADARLKI